MSSNQHSERPEEWKCYPYFANHPQSDEFVEVVTREWHDYWTGRLEEQLEALREAACMALACAEEYAPCPTCEERLREAIGD